MNFDQLRRTLALVVQAHDKKVHIWRPVIDMNGHVVKRIYRGSFNPTRASQNSEPPSKGPTP